MGSGGFIVLWAQSNSFCQPEKGKLFCSVSVTCAVLFIYLFYLLTVLSAFTVCIVCSFPLHFLFPLLIICVFSVTELSLGGF